MDGTLNGTACAGVVVRATGAGGAPVTLTLPAGVLRPVGFADDERLLAIEESILQELEIPYRVVAIAVDDLGASAAMKYDCEGWLPGQGRFRELTSCSNTTDYQARRLDIRYRPADGGRPVHVHTLNGTAVAVGRTIIALLENGQQDDGSVALPEVLTRFGAPERLPAA